MLKRNVDEVTSLSEFFLCGGQFFCGKAIYYLPVGVVVKDVAIGTGGLGIDSRASQIGHCLCYPGAKQ